MPRRSTTRILLVTALLLLSSCSSAPTPPLVLTATPPPPPTETQSAPTNPALPSETPTPPATVTPDLEHPQYAIDLGLNYSARVATVNETITYPNWTGETLNELVLAVEPNLWSGGFSLKSIAIAGEPVTNYTLENLSQRLEIPLPQPLGPSGMLTMTLTYGLVLPQMQAYIAASNDVRPQIYGYSDKQVNFVDWYPFVVPYVPGQGWLLHNPWFYGEHLVYDVAGFDVTVTFTDGAHPLVAASGVEVDPKNTSALEAVPLTPTATPSGVSSRRFVLEEGRTFALSMSDFFKVATKTVGDVTVFAYYFGVYNASGEALLQTTVEAMQTFSERFGPYRHKTLTAVQGDFNDGMEFSGLYFISRDYFNLYDGTPKNYLVTIAAHETAHQWWFDAVGNDQALDPWLDEALATYSERIYYEEVYPDMVDWWWGYRYFEFLKAGAVDTAIYDGEGQRPYWDKVYLTGARFLEDLRQRVGDEIFFAFLSDYYTQETDKRATGADFFRVFHEHSAADLTDLFTKYFKNTYFEMKTSLSPRPAGLRLHTLLRFSMFLLLLTACSLPSAMAAPPPALVLVTANPSASPTSTPFQPIGNQVAVDPPTLAATFTPQPPTDTPPPTLEFTATALASPTAPSASARTQYTLFALLDYAGRELAVDETVAYSNQTGVALGEIVMAVEPNLYGGFSLENILLDGNPLTYDLNGQRLTVPLPQALAPGAQLNLSMRFRISIPAKVKAHPYGYDVDQVNLTDWYPFVVPFSNGWLLHDPTSVGEHLVYDASDFEVNIRTTQTGVVIAASGAPDPEPNGEWTRYRLMGARTFVFSASDQFLVYDATAGAAAAQIHSYFYPGYETEGAAILNAATRAIGIFEAKFGPYPYGSLSIVQADLNDGQEYDGLVFLATKFYNEYEGSARSNLVAIGVHEMAHQWWFGLVGNDQAMEPWLDEALAVYSEAIFYKFIYPNSADWWWNFRVNYFGPSGYVDTNIYEAPSFRGYVNAAYLNGANFIEALNYRMGDDDFYRFLQDYTSRYGRGRATAADFFAVARQNTTADISDLIASYFRGNY